MKAVIEGKTITKREWDDPNVYACLRDGTLQIHLEDGWHTWIINEGDLMGTDWEVIPDSPNTPIQ
jgi:hypothetical protein